MPKHWFRIHLLTGVILMFVASGLLWLNLPRDLNSTSPKAAEIRKRLANRKTSFEFVDKPFDEAVGVITKQAETTVEIDPRLVDEGQPPVNLRVTDISLDLALQWTLLLIGDDFDYAVRDEGLYIYRRDPFGFPLPCMDRTFSKRTPEPSRTMGYAITSTQNFTLNILIWLGILIFTAVSVEFILRRSSRNRPASR